MTLVRDSDACYMYYNVTWCAHVTVGVHVRAGVPMFTPSETIPSTSISLDAHCAILTLKWLPTYHLLLLLALLNHLHEGQLMLSCKDTPQAAHQWTVPPVEHLQALGPHQNLNKSQWIYFLMMVRSSSVFRGCKRFGIVSCAIYLILWTVTDVWGSTWCI